MKLRFAFCYVLTERMMQPFCQEVRLSFMKVGALLYLIVAGHLTATAQCCPYVDAIELIPASPADTDSVYLITHVTTPNMGSYLGYVFTDLGTTLKVEACYYNGMLTALQSYTDTINLGVRPAGNYTVDFIAYLSNDNSVCDYADTTVTSASLTITGSLNTAEIRNNLRVYPNPVKDGIVYAEHGASCVERYKLYTTQGVLVDSGTPDKSGAIDVRNHQGIYFLVLLGSWGTETRKIWLE